MNSKLKAKDALFLVLISSVVIMILISLYQVFKSIS